MYTFLDSTQFGRVVTSYRIASPSLLLKTERRGKRMQKLDCTGLSALYWDSEPRIHSLSPTRRMTKGHCFHWFGRLKRTAMLKSLLRGNPHEEAFCEGNDPKGDRCKGSPSFLKAIDSESPELMPIRGRIHALAVCRRRIISSGNPPDRAKMH